MASSSLLLNPKTAKLSSFASAEETLPVRVAKSLRALVHEDFAFLAFLLEKELFLMLRELRFSPTYIVSVLVCALCDRCLRFESPILRPKCPWTD